MSLPLQPPSDPSGLRDNFSRGTVADFLRTHVKDNSHLSVVSAFFTCPQYFNEIRAGDVVILYFAGKDGGVFGMGRVTNVRAAGKEESVISIRLDKRVTDHLMEHPIPGKAVYGLGMIKNQRQTLHDVTDKWHELTATLSVISSVFS